MLAKVSTAAVVGLDGQLVEVEVDIASGLPSFTIVGLPDTAVQEARERVRAAIRNSGCAFPTRRITVNLAPADLKKAGPAYDLPIAVGILVSSGHVSADTSQSLFLGELSLDGNLRHTHGILFMVSLARDRGIPEVFVPSVDAREASLVEGISVIPVDTLSQLAAHLQGEAIETYQRDEKAMEAVETVPVGIDMAHIKGQEHVKRGLEVAAAGGHNLLMSGPPGSGKTLLARSLPPYFPKWASRKL